MLKGILPPPKKKKKRKGLKQIGANIFETGDSLKIFPKISGKKRFSWKIKISNESRMIILKYFFYPIDSFFNSNSKKTSKVSFEEIGYGTNFIKNNKNLQCQIVTLYRENTFKNSLKMN